MQGTQHKMKVWFNASRKIVISLHFRGMTEFISIGSSRPILIEISFGEFFRIVTRGRFRLSKTGISLWMVIAGVVLAIATSVVATEQLS